MKKILLTTVFCFFVQLLIFGSIPDGLFPLGDSLKNQPALRVNGTQVRQDGVLLTKEEVLQILKPYPDIAARYKKGKNLRYTGTLLVAGSIISLTGGVALMIKGIDASTTDYGYSDDSDMYNTNYYVGMAVVTLAELMLDGGIACNIIGKIQIKRSIANYNSVQNLASRYKTGEINYQFGLLDSGRFGLRLTF